MSSKSYFRSSYRFLTPVPTTQAYPDTHPSFELDESDLYSPKILPTMAHPSPVRSSSSSSQKYVPSMRSLTHPSSLPIDVPDWSKILMGEYRKGYYNDEEEYERLEGDDEMGNRGRGRRVPPHEFLAMQAAKSARVACSVEEGVGRTLKGRELRRVRNAIWEKTGFQD